MNYFKSPKRIITIFYALILAACVLAFTHLSYFVYNNIYQTIYNSDQILILRSMLAIEPVNLDKFNEVIKAIDTKGQKCQNSNNAGQ